jgi:hypothetical protein
LIGGKNRSTRQMKRSQGEIGLLASSPERPKPERPYLIAEPPHARVVTRDGIVVQMPLQHLHPSSGLHEGTVHPLAQLHLDRLELGSHVLLDRLAPEPRLRDRVQK